MLEKPGGWKAGRPGSYEARKLESWEAMKIGSREVQRLSLFGLLQRTAGYLLVVLGHSLQAFKPPGIYDCTSLNN